MPSDSNEYIMFTSSQFTEDNKASLQDTNVDDWCSCWKPGIQSHCQQHVGWFTDDSQPQKKEYVICKHCQQSINHHRKSEPAKNHMNKCSNLCTAMNSMEQADWSDWHIPNKKGGGRNRWQHCQWAWAEPVRPWSGPMCSPTSLRMGKYNSRPR